MKTWIVSALSVLCASCGGGGEGDSTSSLSTPGAVIGQVQGGFSYGVVSVYSWNGEADSLLATTSINRQGKFEVQLEGVSSQSLLLAVQGGYVELADGRFVEMSGATHYRALLDYEQGPLVSVPVTLHSSVVAGLAERKVQLGVLPKIAVKDANEEVGDWLTFEPSNIVPADVRSSEITDLNDQVRYGFIDGAVSQISAWAFQSAAEGDSASLAQAAYRDIKADGALDGIGESGELLFGGAPLSVDRYRQGLALGLLAYANGGRNFTALDVSDLLPYAETLNRSRSPIFAGEPVSPLDTNKPTIAGLSVENNQVVAGVIPITASLIDVVGIEEASLLVDGSQYAFAGASNSPEFSLDTTEFGDGNIEVTILARNPLGAVSEKEVTLVVANDSTTISDIRPFDGQTIGGEFSFAASVSDPGGIQAVRFDVNGKSYFPASLTSPSVTVDTAEFLEQGKVYTLGITVTSQVGATKTESVDFELDNMAPNAEWNLDGVEVLSGSAEISGSFEDNTRVAEARLYIDGEPFQSFGSSPFSTSVDTTSYSDGNYPIALEVVDDVGNATVLAEEVAFDNTPPEVRLANPWEGDVITTSFNIVAFIEDHEQIDDPVIFLVDGAHYSQASADNRVSTELNVNNYANKTNHTIGVSVTDRAGFTTTESVTVYFDY